jgi:hypothetical protein
MTVFIVWAGPWDERDISAIFTTREAAERHAYALRNQRPAQGVAYERSIEVEERDVIER